MNEPQPIPEEFNDGQVERILALREAKELALGSPTAPFSGRAQLIRSKYYVEDIVALAEYILDHVVPEPIAEAEVAPAEYSFPHAEPIRHHYTFGRGDIIGTVGHRGADLPDPYVAPIYGDQTGEARRTVDGRVDPARAKAAGYDEAVEHVAGENVPAEASDNATSIAWDIEPPSVAAISLGEDDGQFLDNAVAGRSLPLRGMHSENDERTEETPPKPEQAEATTWDIERHAQKQGCSYRDAWSYFEDQGYRMGEDVAHYEFDSSVPE